MAKLQMQKIEIIALLKDSKNVIERLQRRKAVELINIDDDKLIKMNTSSEMAQFERSLATATSALEILDKSIGYKPSLLEALNGRHAISTANFAERKKQTDKTLSMCRSITDCSKKISAYKADSVKAQTNIDTLKPWLSMDLPRGFKGTKRTSAFIGSLPGTVSAGEVEAALSGNTGTAADVDIIFSSKEQTGMVIVCGKADEDTVFDRLRDMGFSRIMSESSQTPMEETTALKAQISDNDKKIADCTDKIKSFSDKRGDIEFLIDFLTMRRDKYDAINKLGVSQSTVIISGYIPKKYVDGLISEFDKKYVCAVSIYDPDEDDDVPMLLENGAFSRPVEGITEMYAMPNKRDVDPNPAMAFFYYLFFGMMLSDAGYGLMMIIGTTIALKKFTVEGSLRRSLTMFKYCGISTLIWGALFGSWFGDLPQTIASNFFGREIATTALWFEPLDDPIKLLLFSFGLGIIHLFVGLGVGFKKQWNEGRRFDAICDVIPVYMTVLGVAPMAASILTSVPAVYMNAGKYLAIVGVILIVLTSGRSSKNIFARFFGGLYGLYNTATGYLSDILSYSRLLALGLATGSIASVINLIATMPSNTVVKAVCLIVIGIAGHTANMGINLLGAYVHADRLQFVEFFSKFYEGGGRPFKPLMANTKFIKFEKENIYE